MTIQKGMYIENRYEILEKIGSGGMSDVFKARCHKLNRFVAIKFLKPEYCEDKNFVKNFQIEAQSAAALLHPNVVSVYDVNQTEGIYYIVMEYVDGITLKKYVDRNGRLPVKEATSIAIQIAQGIDAAHNANIIHRDIKPQNVLISREGKIKVTDFGIARTTTANTISTDILGSVQYISPEQARGGQVDARTDIYSFGIVFYEMITGKLPFDGDSTVSIALKHIQENVPLASDVVEGVPSSVTKIIEKCTQRKPDRRYQKTSSLLADLKTSLITPNEDFVVLEPEPADSATIIMSEEDARLLRREGSRSLNRTGTGQTGRTGNIPMDRNYNYPRKERAYTEDDYYDDDSRRISRNASRKAYYRKRRSERILVICGVIAVIIIIAVLLIVCLKTFRSDSNQSSTESESQTTLESNPEVPSVVGMEVSKAQSTLEKLGYIVKVKYAHSESIAKEYVIDQSVKKGINLETGSEITLTVSSGAETVKLEDYSGKDAEEVETELKKLGFKVKITEVFSDDIEEGMIVETSPVANSEVAKDTEIELFVSKGPEVEKVIIPDVSGYTEDSAMEILNNYHLYAWSTYEDSEYYDGIVIAQYPSSGEEVEEWSWVNIVVTTTSWMEPDTETDTEPWIEPDTEPEPIPEPDTSEEFPTE